MNIWSYFSRKTTNDECLTMADHAVNSIIGADGFGPIFLVFGAMLRPEISLPSPTQVERVEAIVKEIKEVQIEQDRKRISFWKRSIGSAKAKEQSESVNRLPAGTKVLVYRNVSKRMRGPFNICLNRWNDRGHTEASWNPVFQINVRASIQVTIFPSSL